MKTEKEKERKMYLGVVPKWMLLFPTFHVRQHCTRPESECLSPEKPSFYTHYPGRKKWIENKEF
jgi:hypothetical protein